MAKRKKEEPTKLDTLTAEQHKLCYSIQFEIIRVICNLDHAWMWNLIKEKLEQEEIDREKSGFDESVGRMDFRTTISGKGSINP